VRKVRSKLRKERLDLRYSMRDISKKTGFSEDYIMKIELGRQNPSLHNAEIIYDTMRKLGMSPKISLRELFEDDGEKR